MIRPFGRRAGRDPLGADRLATATHVPHVMSPALAADLSTWLAPAWAVD